MLNLLSNVSTPAQEAQQGPVEGGGVASGPFRQVIAENGIVVTAAREFTPHPVKLSEQPVVFPLVGGVQGIAGSQHQIFLALQVSLHDSDGGIEPGAGRAGMGADNLRMEEPVDQVKKAFSILIGCAGDRAGARDGMGLVHIIEAFLEWCLKHVK